MIKQIEETANRLHKFITDNNGPPQKRLYFLTQNIAIFHYAHGMVDFPEGPKTRVINLSTGNREERCENIVWEGTVSLEKAKTMLDHLLEDKFILVIKGEWACFALTYYFYDSLKRRVKRHFLKELIEMLMLKYTGFSINKYDLEFLVKLEMETYGKERAFRIGKKNDK